MAIAGDSTAEQAPDTVPHEPPEESSGSPDQPDHGEVDFEEEDGDAEELDGPAAYEERERAVLRRLYGEPVGIRVHDIIIQGNFKTRDELIEAEVADLLRISRERAYQMAAAGGFPSVRLSERRLRVPRDAFNAWLDTQTARAMESIER
jgi:outer membrane protein insertion porin family